MVIIHQSDLPKYVDKNQIRHITGSRKIIRGNAIYLPRKNYFGENIFGDIVSFVSKNKDTISNVASAVGDVAKAVGSVTGTTVDTYKKIKELKELKKVPAITDEAVDKVVNAGSGFYYT